MYQGFANPDICSFNNSQGKDTPFMAAGSCDVNRWENGVLAVPKQNSYC